MRDDEDATERLLNYRAGRLSDEDRAAFEAELADGAEARRSHDLADRIAAGFDAPDATPGEVGWARLKRSIAAEPVAKPKAGFTVWHLAGAAAAAILLWQVGVTPLIERTEPGAGYTTASGDAADILRIAFAPEATEAQIRAVLGEVGGRIVDGPSALGLYSIALPDGADLSAAVSALRARAAVVETVTQP
ncbi:MAG: hypothetical protein AAF415_10160 [Pseudomonadota bacterium]